MRGREEYDSLVRNLYQTVGKKYVRIAGKYVTMNVSEGAQYSKEDKLAVLSYAGVTNSYTTSSIKRLKGLGGIDKGDKSVPTEKTVIDSIRFVDSKTLFQKMREANNHIIQQAVKNNELKDELIAALDIHNVYRHTKIPMSGKRKRKCSDIRTVVGRKPKNGACYAHEYMTVQNIKMKNEPTYVLAFGRVLPLQNVTNIARNLLREAETKTGSKIKLIIADGDFDDIDTMKMFMEEEKHFVVRADQDGKVKKVMEKVKENKNEYHVEYGYIKGNKKNFAKVNLVILDVEWLKKHGIKYPLKKKEYITFFTDLYPEEDETIEHFCLKIAIFYKKRWGIETGYRDISDFEAKTHSLSDSVRLFLYLQAILLYNIWVGVNFMYKDDPIRKKYFRDGISKDFIRFLIEQWIIREFTEKKGYDP